jgi:hypothetical protein
VPADGAITANLKDDEAVKFKPLPSQRALRERFSYDQETGILTWKALPVSMFAAVRHQTAEDRQRQWNAKYAGKEAGAASNGYRYLKIKGERYAVHRIIWKMVKGRNPKMIDHVEGEIDNNRIAEMRNTSAQGNARNRGLTTRNISGRIGVAWIPRSNKWRASGRVNGKTQHIVETASLEDAKEARSKWERANGFHRNHGQRQATSQRKTS